MKNISLTLIIIFAVAINLNAQTVRRVNKTPGLNDPAIYVSVQAAHDASAPGDVIYVEPTDVSSGNYDGVLGSTTTITKKITIIGTGFDLAQTPNTAFDKRGVKLSNLTFQNGSTGSLIMGMDISSVSVFDSLVTITRCDISSLSLGISTTLLGGVYSKGNKATITNNRIAGSITGGNRTNCVITNNIFRSGTISNLLAAVINYNSMYCSASSIFTTVTGSTITGNIFDARDRVLGYLVLAASSTGNNVTNNMCTSIVGLPTSGSNVNSTSPALVFTVSNPWTASPYSDSNIQLPVASPARTTAPGSTQAGAFGGTNPYVLSGVPNVPVITSFSNTGAGTTATPLSVTISVRSAN